MGAGISLFLCFPGEEEAPASKGPAAAGGASAAAPPPPGKVAERKPCYHSSRGQVCQAPPGKLGVLFGKDPATGYVKVKIVLETSPLRGKLKVNDIVIAVDGEDTSKHTQEEIVKRKLCVNGSSRPSCEKRVEPATDIPLVAVFRPVIWTHFDRLPLWLRASDLTDKEASTRTLTLRGKV